MMGAKVFPMKPQSLFEAVLEAGVRIMYRMGHYWNNADNYLLASGRCLAFRAKFVKQFAIPDTVINSDAYLYFENKRRSGVFVFDTHAMVYIKSPQNLQEHLKQSRKFLYSQKELSHLYEHAIDLEEEYAVPFFIKVRAYTAEFFHKPFISLLYLADFIYTRTQQKNMYDNKTRFWETDKSTKEA
jgi:ribosomal protein S15P/S13E